MGKIASLVWIVDVIVEFLRNPLAAQVPADLPGNEAIRGGANGMADNQLVMPIHLCVRSKT